MPFIEALVLAMFVVPGTLAIDGSPMMFAVLMYPARCRSARRRSMAVRIVASAAAPRASSLKVRVASRDSAMMPSATMSPATSDTVSSMSVKPDWRRRRRRLIGPGSP